MKYTCYSAPNDCCTKGWFQCTYEGTYLSTIWLNCASFKLNVHSEEASSVINVTCMIIKCIILFQKNYFCNGLSVSDLIYNQMLILEDSH